MAAVEAFTPAWHDYSPHAHDERPENFDHGAAASAAVIATHSPN